ncbi:MAG: hypothetical protein PHS97_05555 [Oscillospiraceae bacterium]|nr:hypothetical protein [Oscillospiraceae bacterium]
MVLHDRVWESSTVPDYFYLGSFALIRGFFFALERLAVRDETSGFLMDIAKDKLLSIRVWAMFRPLREPPENQGLTLNIFATMRITYMTEWLAQKWKTRNAHPFSKTAQKSETPNGDFDWKIKEINQLHLIFFIYTAILC